jgi:hypothetical protein
VLYSGGVVTEGAREQGRGVGGLSSRVAPWLAWSLAGLSVAMAAASVALHIATQSVQPPSSWGTGGNSAVLVFVLPFLAFPLVGALIASRRPNNPIGWICLAVGIFWMLVLVSDAYGLYGLVVRPGSVPFPAAIGSVGEWMWAPTVGLFGIYLLLLFPDGKLPSRRWLPVAWLAGAVIFLVSAGGAIEPGPVEGLPGVRNPFGLEGSAWVADATQGVILLLPVCILASATSLVLRFLHSEGEQREQIKWLAFAALIFGSGFSFFVIFGSILPEATAGANLLLENLLEDAVTLSFAGVPVAIGFAVLKYRLYEIDIIINRTLVYGSLTATLAMIYFGGVATAQAIFRALTGQEQQPQLAIVVSTLVIAALFNPLRRRIQGFIERSFYRSKYDARKTLEAFSAKLRDETDLESLNRELVGVVKETMQPAHVSLWLRPDLPPRRSEGREQVS